MPMRLPRTLRISSGGRLSIRAPESQISPPAMRPGGSMRPITAEPVTDLPAPDSPTTPSTSPLAMSKETPSMAFRTPRRVTNSTRRSRTERTGGVTIGASDADRRRRGRDGPLSEPRIQHIPQPVAEEVDGEGEEDQGQ